MDIKDYCLVFPFFRANANAICALLGAIDIHSELSELPVYLPNLRDEARSLKNKLLDHSNVILAFSLFSTQLLGVSEKIKEYRLAYPNKRLLVIAGGPHPIGSPRSMLHHEADIVCTGEGEIVFTELIQHFMEYRISDEFYKNLGRIKGIAFMSGNEMIKTGKSIPVNLDKFPPFSVKRGLIRPIEITRGCAWNCRFCQTRSKGIPVKHRSVNVVLKYVKETVKYFEERRPDIRFISPNALSYGSKDGRSVNLEVVEELLSKIRNVIGEEGKIFFGSFPSEVRPETITPESVFLLKQYTNATKIIIGAQSGSDKVLEISERGHNAKETVRAVELLIGAGFQVSVDIIFGLPGEDDEDVKQTISHIKELTEMGAIIHSHTFMPLVGTPFANKDPGKVHVQYVNLISNLQGSNQLYGSHIKQQKDAKEMAERRIKEKNL